MPDFLRWILPSRQGPLRDSLTRWLASGIAIGIASGLGAVIFYWCITHGTQWLLVDLAGYRQPTAFGEDGGFSGGSFTRPWAIPLVAGGAALIAGVLVALVAPEARGHGTDSAISAVHNNPTGMRGRVAAVKVVASSLIIGSGGSAGPEGPTAQISATIISKACARLHIPRIDARIAVSAAMASGIGAIFRAPLGGALLGAELLYRDDLEADAIMPSLISSIVSYAIYASIYGFGPVFGQLSWFSFSHPFALIFYALLGLVAGLVGLLFIKTFYGGATFFRKLPIPRAVTPAIGGLCVGALGLAVPQVLGTGYGWVQLEMTAHWLLSTPLWLVLLIPVAKIIATTLSISSGGSGGVFGPGMVIGGCTGAAIWRLAHGLPGVPDSPVPWIIIGMIACFGAVAHAPLGMMLMVAEMTGNLSLLAPAMIAVAIASLVVGKRTIFRSQLKDRREAMAVLRNDSAAIEVPQPEETRPADPQRFETNDE